MGALEELFQAIVEQKQAGEELARKALEEGATPTSILTEAISPAMSVVEKRLEVGECFMPEVLLSARVAKRAADVVAPLLAQDDDAKASGRVVLGTVEGDLHSIDKDLLKMLLEAGGVQVMDLGVDVSAHQFVSAALEERADVVAMFALLTTTMSSMRDVIEALEEAGYRNHVRVLLGGAPVTQYFADEIGADGYRSCVAAGARLVQTWLASNR